MLQNTGETFAEALTTLDNNFSVKKDIPFEGSRFHQVKQETKVLNNTSPGYNSFVYTVNILILMSKYEVMVSPLVSHQSYVNATSLKQI